MEKKLYTIQDSPNYFRTGESKINGKKAIFGIRGNQIVRLGFSATGEFLGVEKRHLSDDSDVEPEDSVAVWMNEENYNPGMIQIRKFWIPEYSAGILDVPKYLLEYEENSVSVPEAERQFFAEDLLKWRNKQNFVFVWDESYEMTKDGEVEST